VSNLNADQRGALARQGIEPDDYELRKAKVRIRIMGDFISRKDLSVERFEQSLLEWFERDLEEISSSILDRKVRVTVENQHD
jgi:hypothetical protein